MPSELLLLPYLYSVYGIQGETWGEILVYSNICMTYRTKAGVFLAILNGIFPFTIHTKDIQVVVKSSIETYVVSLTARKKLLSW